MTWLLGRLVDDFTIGAATGSAVRVVIVIPIAVLIATRERKEQY